MVAIYVKGAPEVVLSLCQTVLTKDGTAELGEDEREEINANVNRMAGEPLRVLALAYTEMSLTDWSEQFASQEGSPERILEEAICNEQLPLAFITAFGLKDQLRSKVQSCVRFAREYGHLGVRLVSGDHIETAKAMAIRAGILKPEEVGRAHAVMLADDFRAAVGSLVQRRDEITDQITTEVENQEAFREVAQNLRVLARATASDKHLLVVGLKGLGKQVSVTGDGINDVESLQRADVGLAMGSGCSAAKESADLILTDNDFEASLRAVMWGRNIFHNVSRFLQFQITVNISALLVIFFGYMIFSESPLSAVQLLWINLIMDTFAALALSTEPPLPQVIQGSPFKENVSILSGTIWRQILGVSLYNVVVMLVLMFFGKMVLDLDYDMSDLAQNGIEPDDKASAEWRSWSASHDKVKHFTFIFNLFVFLQLFNMVNCRKVGRRDFNVFEKFFHNWYFLFFFFGEGAVQIALNQYFPSLTKQIVLSKNEIGAIITLASTVIFVAFILKLTPETWVAAIPTSRMIDEDKEVSNKMLSKWKGQDNKEMSDDFQEAPETDEQDFTTAP